MEYRKLGQTGLKVSALGIGAWQLGGPLVLDGIQDGHPDPGKDKVLYMIQALADHGINFIDTAEQYSNGESERRVGEAIKSRRNEWVLSTKFGHKVGPNNTRVEDTSPESIMPAIEGSLSRLQTDRIEVYHFHTHPIIEQLDEIAEVLNQAKKQGKILNVAVSTNDINMIKELHSRSMIDVVQYVSSMFEPFADVQAYVKENNLGGIVRGVVSQGRLSGKYFAQNPQPKVGDRRIELREDFTRFAPLAKLCPEGMTMLETAIRFVLDQEATSTIILGSKTLQEYEVALKSLSFSRIEADTRQQLFELGQKLLAI
jgi:aryl-alcohol dehydrogenase-like predicted oxidoreductase